MANTARDFLGVLIPLYLRISLRERPYMSCQMEMLRIRPPMGGQVWKGAETGHSARPGPVFEGLETHWIPKKGRAEEQVWWR